NHTDGAKRNKQQGQALTLNSSHDSGSVKLSKKPACLKVICRQSAPLMKLILQMRVDYCRKLSCVNRVSLPSGHGRILNWIISTKLTFIL
ncbi:hypothetical protein, partial [Undibacterium sp. 5I1]|uniref:hypothetical protein n=1 Tax=Undibacterium sp. 5I1 TaxID=3048590 RepID=UPI002B22B566